MTDTPVRTRRPRAGVVERNESPVSSSRTQGDVPIVLPVHERPTSRRGSMTKKQRDAAATGPLAVSRSPLLDEIEVVDLGGYVWDRLTRDGENDVQFKAFQAFLATAKWDDPTSRRTLEATATVTGQKLATLTAWARSFHWKQRADAHDDHMARVAQEAFEHQVRKVGERRAQIAMRALDAAEISIVAGAKGLENYAKPDADPTHKRLVPEDAFDALKAGAVLIKDVAGQVAPPSSTVRVEHGGRVEVDVAAELRALIADVRQPAPGPDRGAAVVHAGAVDEDRGPGIAIGAGGDAESPQTASPDG